MKFGFYAVRQYLVASLVVALFSSQSSAADIIVGSFSPGRLDGWKPQTFRGKAETKFSLAREGEKTVLKAHSRNSASGLIKTVKVEPERYPVLRWSWKVDRLLKGEDGTRKEGDDYPARVYVVFPGTFFWQTKAIVYVWSGKLAEGAALRNPYTSNAVIVPVESGQERVGKWVNEERNYHEDFRRFFRENPPRTGAVAVMTDTDDTGEETTAWYGDIVLVQRGSQKTP
jgi:hypothetical protein